MPDQAPIDSQAARQLLEEATLTISSFRNKLAAAGYPFREPPNVSRIIQEIDMLLDVELANTNKRDKSASLEIPVFIAR